MFLLERDQIFKKCMWQSRQLNFLQNDARFSLLGQKLEEGIHLGYQKVYFLGGEKNTSTYNKM